MLDEARFLQFLQKRRPQSPAFTLEGLDGYAELPEATALRARLEAEQAAQLAEGIHLIVVQGADGGLVVGDSHHYDWSPSPFAEAEVDNLILDDVDRCAD